MKRINTVLFVTLLLFTQCNKGTDATSPVAKEGIKFELISGSGQWDTIGNQLEKPVVFKVTKNKIPLKNYRVEIEQINCAYIPLHHIQTNEDGIATFNWTLHGMIGDQIIKAFTIDDLGKPTDSITVHAEGKFFDNAWQPGSCLPLAGITDICQSASGRIFCGIGGLQYPYYSDDNGVSWKKLTSFPSDMYEIWKLASYGSEIFIATRNHGIYYSPDNGTTWERRSNGITDTYSTRGFGITRSGKLFYNTLNTVLQISSDKGKSWTSVTNGIPNGENLIDFDEDSRGVYYALSEYGDVYSSSDRISWKHDPISSKHPGALFIDDNDDLYLGINGFINEVLRSSDHGTTWSSIYKSAEKHSNDLKVKQFYKVNGNFYFMISAYGIIKTTNFSSFQTLTTRTHFCYLATKNDGLIVPGTFDGLWYNLKP
jgi:photosystem II stability/assembly factor-like uncharacterized protein